MKNNELFPTVAWVLLTIACLVIIITGLRAAVQKTGWTKEYSRKIIFRSSIFIIIWTAVLTILSYRGFFSDFSLLPPRPALAMLIPLPVILLVAFSKKGTQLLQAIPPHWIVWMQSFRIAVELLLLLAFINNRIPVQMTFEGRNFDILTGILALPVGYALSKRKSFAPGLAIAFNVTGILLLINILVIAVLSMPTPIRYFMNEPSNTLVGLFPYILLPGVLVPIAYTMHIFSLRQLLVRSRVIKPSAQRSPLSKTGLTA
jgi:hypothetical protein